MGFLYLIESYDKALSAKVHNLTIGAMEYIAVFFGFIFNQYLIWLVPFFTYFKTIENSEFGNNLLGGSHFAEGYGKLGTIAVMYYLFSVVLTVVITQSNKIIFGRVRPALINPNQRFNLRKFEGNCSMPSGDTAQAANWGLFMAINTQNPIYLLAILPVAFARVYFQLHWIGDTVIGTAIGVTVCVFCDSIKYTLVNIILKLLSMI